MRCWAPRPGNRQSYSDPNEQEKLRRALQQELTAGVAIPAEMYPVTTNNPLNMFGPIKNVMPMHYAVGLIGKTGNHLRSDCLDFDYGAAAASSSLGDPAGCNFFRASFQPVQKVARCVQAKIEADPYWHLWNKIFDHVAWGAKDPDNDFGHGVEAATVSAEARRHLNGTGLLSWDLTEPRVIGDTMAAWRSSNRWFGCDKIRIFHRTMEILKHVELQDWDLMDSVLRVGSVGAVREELRKAFLDTMTVPPESPIPALTNATVEAISGECFGLDAALHDEPISDETALLKESMQCLPLIWDKVEVPGAPRTMLWPTDWDPPIEHRLQVPPLCARVALAGLVRNFTRAEYPSGARLIQLTSKEKHSDRFCFDPHYAQCKNFKNCWHQTMFRHMGKINPTCQAKDPNE